MDEQLGARSRPRLCLATDSRDPSGLGRMLLDLAAAAGQDFEVTVVADPATGLLDRARELGCRAVELSHDPAEALAQAQPDLLHVHAGIGWEGHALTAAGAAAGLPVLRTEHLPWLLTDQAQIDEYRDALRHVTRVVAVGHGVAHSYAAAGVPPQLLTVIPNGVESPRPGRAREDVRRDLGLRDEPLILHVGRYTPQKRHDLLLAAVSRLTPVLPNVRLALVGTGEGRSAAEALAADLGIADRVLFLGAREDVPDLYGAADALALPSVFEGLALVLLEAMAAGLPVVAARVTGIAEAIDAGTGHIVEPGDVDALAEALRDALADRAEARRRADRARERHAARYRRSRMTDATLDLYHQTLQEKTS